MLSGSRLMNVVYLSLKVMRSSMGRLLMMLEFRSGVSTMYIVEDSTRVILLHTFNDRFQVPDFQ